MHSYPAATTSSTPANMRTISASATGPTFQYPRGERLSLGSQRHRWSQASTSPSHSASSVASADYYVSDSQFPPRHPRSERPNKRFPEPSSASSSQWTASPSSTYSYQSNTITPTSLRAHDPNWASSWPDASPSPTSPTSSQPQPYTQRRPSNRDEFDGPSQLLSPPSTLTPEPTESDLPTLPLHLHAHEQDQILNTVNDRLSRCAYDFVARYQFPIPLEPSKRPVHIPSDREWSEWVYLLKRLATKRRLPARVLYHAQIKQLVTILENSLEMRHAAKHQSRPLKDDRNVLQLISSGLQVAKMLKDGSAMRDLDELYVRTERMIWSRSGKSEGGMPTV